MSEQTDDPTLNEDTGTTTPEVEQHNWEDRYKEAQAWGTRMAQERSQYETAAQQLERLRTDQDAQREFLSELGYQVEADDDIPDPSAELVARLQRMEESFEQMTKAQQAEAQQQKDLQTIGNGIISLQEQIGRNLTEDEMLLLDGAARSTRNEQGLPDIDGVTKRWLAAREYDQTTWASSKKKASRQSAAGQAGTNQPDVLNMTDAERQHWMVQQLQSMED